MVQPDVEYFLYLSFRFSLLVVLNIVHDMVDTVLVSREQGGGHNGVQAVKKN